MRVHAHTVNSLRISLCQQPSSAPHYLGIEARALGQPFEKLVTQARIKLDLPVPLKIE